MATSVIDHCGWGARSALAHADGNPESNLLLAALPAAAALLLDKHLRRHEFDEGTVLWQAGRPAGLVFFPVSGIITVKSRTLSPLAQLFLDRLRSIVKPLMKAR